MASPPSSSYQPLTDQTSPPTPGDAAAATTATGAPVTTAAVSSGQQSLQTSRQDAAPPVEMQKTKPALFEDADIAEYMKKQTKYETIYARRLKAKYFSKKAFNGGDIFDHETAIDNEIIRSSRWPCTRSFADPVLDPGDPSGSPSLAEETSATANKKHPSKKSC